MIAVTALRLAGPAAVLASRPRGVLHVYTGGTLTPSGRYLPRAAKAVCRSHTRRLSVRPRGAVPANRRVCVRCSTTLSKLPRPVTRDEYLARFGHLDLWDLVAEAEAADTSGWVDTIAHLALLVLGHAGCKTPIPGRDRLTVHQLLGRCRDRVDPTTADARDARWRELGETARNARKAERAEIHKQAEARIARIGINNAKPHPRKKEPTR